MSHAWTLVVLLLAPFAAGCISLPDEARSADSRPELPPLPEERFDGMSAEASAEDSVDACDNGGGLQIPPGSVCARRQLLVTGRTGVVHLPVELTTLNGAVSLVAGPGDAWSFAADIRVRALTEEAARKGLDTTWAWSHEDSEGHHLRAAPVAPSAGSVEALGATLEYASYQIVLPAWAILDVRASGTNGAMTVTGFQMDGLDLSTTNGALVAHARAPAARLVTTNGAIEAQLTPTGSGTFTLETTNGRLGLAVPEGPSRGYDASATTTNGRIDVALRDGETSETHAPGSSTVRFLTRGYDSRTIQTSVSLSTTNGAIALTPLGE